ncbi:MAG: Holliday junction branch migration DNA helicase RuvB [Myxococcota bacterium]|jgi:Holliday junction DNA helicase RuvB|nr:Holliday junction branch migration DNA helicase RuvB [Myxococcota bacterium]
MSEQVLSSELEGSAGGLEKALRPKGFDDYVGQREIKENLGVFVDAARQRNNALCHVLLHGPPGLGKTSLAHVVAHEMGSELFVTSGPSLERQGDLAGILTGLEHGSILFIDEIHRLSPVVEENLYSAMEDFRFDVVIGDGPGARTVPITLEPFTLIGATTRTGLLTGPLRDRFGYTARLEYYDVQELGFIIERSANLLSLDIVEAATAELAKRSRGTPRIANRLLRRVRDYAQVVGSGRVDLQITRHALERLGVDALGLDRLDLTYLNCLINQFQGGPVGIETLSAAVAEQADTLQDVCEPYLMKLGFLQRTPRGRQATERAFAHLGCQPSPGFQSGMPDF